MLFVIHPLTSSAYYLQLLFCSWCVVRDRHHSCFDHPIGTKKGPIVWQCQGSYLTGRKFDSGNLYKIASFLKYSNQLFSLSKTLPSMLSQSLVSVGACALIVAVGDEAESWMQRRQCRVGCNGVNQVQGGVQVGGSRRSACYVKRSLQQR